jgi:hypothetical protein
MDRIVSVRDDAAAWGSEFAIGHALGGRWQIPRFSEFPAERRVARRRDANDRRARQNFPIPRPSERQAAYNLQSRSNNALHGISLTADSSQG